ARIKLSDRNSKSFSRVRGGECLEPSSISGRGPFPDLTRNCGSCPLLRSRLLFGFQRPNRLAVGSERPFNRCPPPCQGGTNPLRPCPARTKEGTSSDDRGHSPRPSTFNAASTHAIPEGRRAPPGGAGDGVRCGRRTRRPHDSRRSKGLLDEPE